MASGQLKGKLHPHVAGANYGRPALLQKIRHLEDRLRESETILGAIRSGEVDVLMVKTDAGDRILSLNGAQSAYQHLVESMNEGAAVLTCDGVILYCNRRLADLLAIRLESLMASSLCDHIDPQCRETFAALLQQGVTTACSGELTALTRNHNTVPVQLSLSPFNLSGQIGACVVITDLTEQKRIEKQLLDLSLKDDLTGLLNRRGFFVVAQQQLKMTKRMTGTPILFYADVDGLKQINDSLGHAIGDQAIVDLADALRATFRDSDILARIGGDEFVVLATTAPTSLPEFLVGRMQRQIRAINCQRKRLYQLSVSLGYVSGLPDAFPSVEELIRLADHAMYTRKRRHKRQVLKLVRKYPQSDS